MVRIGRVLRFLVHALTGDEVVEGCDETKGEPDPVVLSCSYGPHPL